MVNSLHKIRFSLGECVIQSCVLCKKADPSMGQRYLLNIMPELEHDQEATVAPV